MLLGFRNLARDRPYLFFGRRYQLSVRLNVMNVLRRWTVVGFYFSLLQSDPLLVGTRSRRLIPLDCTRYLFLSLDITRYKQERLLLLLNVYFSLLLLDPLLVVTHSRRLILLVSTSVTR